MISVIIFDTNNTLKLPLLFEVEIDRGKRREAIDRRYDKKT